MTLQRGEKANAVKGECHDPAKSHPNPHAKPFLFQTGTVCQKTVDQRVLRPA
jgi:hypothetical protein